MTQVTLDAEDLAGSPPSLDLVQFARVLVDNWRLVFLTPFLLAVASGALSYAMPKSYRAGVMFLAEREANLLAGAGALAGLAGQLGFQLGSSSGQSPRFYADLAGSREMLERLLSTEMPPSGEVEARMLIDWIEPPMEDSVKRVQRAVRRLNNAIEVVADLQTGTVRVELEAPDPIVAAAAANHLVEYFNDFNVVTRRSQAQERRGFVQERYEEVAGELGEAESAVKDFLERNRLYQDSPELMYGYERLQRVVQLRHEVFITLAREVETARIEEVNDIPVLTVIDRAIPPVERSSPRRKLIVISVGLFSFVVMVVAAFILENVRRRLAAQDPNALALQGRWQRLRARLSPARKAG